MEDKLKSIINEIFKNKIVNNEESTPLVHEVNVWEEEGELFESHTLKNNKRSMTMSKKAYNDFINYCKKEFKKNNVFIIKTDKQ